MNTTRDGTLIDAIIPRPSDRTLAIARDATLVSAGILLMTLAAQVNIPWYPVPLTGGTFGALLIGGLLGFRRGTLSLALYVLVGILGLGVFSEWSGGWDYFTGSTGGYLIGYVFAAALVGFFADRGFDRSITSMVGILLIANAIIYAVGVPWLAAWTAPGAEAAFGWSAAYEFGLQPFIPGDIVKLFFAACLLPGGWALMRKLGAKDDPPAGS
ncbi:MAG: biotin transporter BioY [Miltoncostaeaceae bacterium]